MYLFRTSLLMAALLSTIGCIWAKTPIFSPYADLTLNVHWDNTTNSLEPYDWAEVATTDGIPSFHLAFITDAGRCQPAFGGQDSYGLNQPFAKALTRKLAQSRVDTVISFGGALGNDLSLYCSEDQLVGIFNQTLSAYQARGLDFDIENGSTDVPKLMRALKRFQQKQPQIALSLTLPVLPEGLTWEGKDIVNQAKLAGLSFQVNIMAMDYGPSYSGNMANYAIQAATALHSQLKALYPEQTDAAIWKRIAVTPMIGVNDVQVEQFNLQDAKSLAKFANTRQLGGLSIWSMNRDKPCADRLASPTCSGNNLQKTAYEFIRQFLTAG